MSILTKAQLEALNQASFPDQSTEAITPQILREYNTATIDSFVDSLDTGSFATDITDLNEFTASQQSKDSTLATYTGSNDTKWNTLGSQSGSWITESETGSFATTGSNTFVGKQNIQGTLTASLQQGYAWVGGVGNVTNAVPTSSFGGGGSIVGYATTGSNTFVGNQTISTNLSKNGIAFESGSGTKYFIGNDNSNNLSLGTDTVKYIELVGDSGRIEFNSNFNANQSATFRGVAEMRSVYQENGYPFVINGQFSASIADGYVFVGGVDGYTHPIPTASFAGAAPIGTATTGSNTFNGNQNIIGTLTASIDEGFVLVGGVGNVSKLVATSSFGGGGDSFPYTGDAQITGSLTITGSSASQKLIVKSQNENSVISENSLYFNSSSILQAIYGQDGSYITNNTKGLVNGTSQFAIDNGLTTVPTNSLGLFYGTAGGFTDGISLISTDINSNLITIGGNSSSTNINGSLSVSTDITADRLVLTGGTGLDLIITGSGKITTALTVGPTVGDAASVSGLGISIINSQTADELGFTNNGSEYGVSGWNGPSIYGNDPTDSYPAFIGFQNKGDWTNGKVSILKPLDVSGSINQTGGNVTITGSILQSGGNSTFAADVTMNSNLNVGLNITADKLVLTGGSGLDLSVTGSARISNTLNVGVSGGESALLNQYGFSAINDATGDDTGITGNGADYGVSGWNGPSIYGNDPDDLYPAFIGFQNKADWTDGTITVLKPLDVSGSLSVASGSDFYAHQHKQFNVGAFQSNVSQSGSANVSQSMQFEVTDTSYGVTMISNSRITIANAGVYNIQFSAQLLANTGADDVYIWLKKNGTNVSASGGRVTLANNEELITAWNYIVEAANNDYYEIAWESSNGDALILQEPASGNVPSIPSVILTVTQVR